MSDKLAFKMLGMSSDYTPEISAYKEGVVSQFLSEIWSMFLQRVNIIVLLSQKNEICRKVSKVTSERAHCHFRNKSKVVGIYRSAPKDFRAKICRMLSKIIFSGHRL